MNYTISEKYQLMSQSEFNKLAKKIDAETVNVAAGEAFIYDSSYMEGHEFSPQYKGNKVVFQIGNETKQLKIQDANDVAITNLDELVVVVSDEMYEQAKQAFGTRVVKILM